VTRDEARGLIAHMLGCEPEFATDDARLWDDLGADSLDYIELAMAIETKDDCGIPDEEIAEWVTVGDVIRSAEAVRV
jgi:acyl carrier protein